MTALILLKELKLNWFDMKHVFSRFRKWYSYKFLKNINSKWFNPFLTFYFNFVFFPIRQAIKFPLYVYGWPKIYCQLGKMICVGKCLRGMIRLNVSIPFGPQAVLGNTEISLCENGMVMFHGFCEIGTGVRINVGQNAVLEFGNCSKLLAMCNLTTYDSISIGDNTRITHRCQIFDNNFHFIANMDKKNVPNILRPVRIGSNCWICNNSTINAGAIIPDNTIVASNSLVSKDYSFVPSNSIIGGVPAKLIRSGHKRIFNTELTNKLWCHYIIKRKMDMFLLPEDFDFTNCDGDGNMDW